MTSLPTPDHLIETTKPSTPRGRYRPGDAPIDQGLHNVQAVPDDQLHDLQARRPPGSKGDRSDSGISLPTNGQLQDDLADRSEVFGADSITVDRVRRELATAQALLEAVNAP